MTTTRLGGIVLLVPLGVVACGAYSDSATTAPSPLPTAPSPPPAPTAPTLITFSESSTGFSTSEVRDVQEQVLQINTAGELIWTHDGTRLPGYRVERSAPYPDVSYITGRICAEGCAFEVRFGTKDGERRAYLTVDYGHDNPGTLVDVEVAAGALVVTRTTVFAPGTFTLSGVVTEATASGDVPIEGAFVYRRMVSGWQEGMTDRDGVYRIFGMFDGVGPVSASKEGFIQADHQNVSIKGDTRFDIRLLRR